MDYESIIKNYTEEKKDEVVRLAKANKAEMVLNNLYHNRALDVFFSLWHDHFPNVKQSKSCRGCREAVVKFFNNVSDYISSERLKAAETAKAETAKAETAKAKTVKTVKKKNKKPAKHITRTGALASSGPRS